MLNSSSRPQNRQQLEKTNAILLLRCFLFLCAAAIFSGQEDGQAIFYGSAIITSCAAAFTALRQKTVFRLDVAFILGFLMICCLEGIASAQTISIAPGPTHYLTAARTIACGAFCFLAGHDLVFSITTQRTTLSSKQICASTATGSKYFIFGLAALTALAYTPFVIYGFSSGRLRAFQATSDQFATLFPSLLGAFLGHIAMAGGILLPAAIAYHFRFHTKTRSSVFQAVAWSSPALFLLASTGTRARLTVGLLGLLVSCVAGKPRHYKHIAVFTAVAFASVSVGLVMLQSRGSGWKDANASQLTAYTKIPEYFNERTVLAVAKLSDLYATRPREPGRHTSFYLVFWVPRMLWPEKPVGIQNWWWKVYEPHVRRRSSHSAATSFVGPFFADFGTSGACMALFLAGLGFGLLDHLFVNGFNNPGGSLTPFICMLFPLSMFLPRQIGTAWFWGVYMLVITVVLVILERLFRKQYQRHHLLSDVHSGALRVR